MECVGWFMCRASEGWSREDGDGGVGLWENVGNVGGGCGGEGGPAGGIGVEL